MKLKNVVLMVAAGLVAASLLAVCERQGQVDIISLMRSYATGRQTLPSLRTPWASEAWADQKVAPTPSGSVADGKLRGALQKRLLVPNPSDLTIGPPTPTPFSGVSGRTITISAGNGQKIELELFTSGSADKAMLAQRFAYFDPSHPWDKVDLKQLHIDDRPTLGPASAPIEIVEFADFECPYCARAFNEVETLVTNTYKDRVRLVWKNFPLSMHPWAEQAAIAAECSRQQNPEAFWTFARNFYRDQSEITPQNLRQHIDSYSTSLHLDGKALNACMLADAAEARVEQDKKDAEAIHIASTPTFIVNGVPVIGLPSSNVFDFVITSQMHERAAAH
jgi:protein-disulfide isomerase